MHELTLRADEVDPYRKPEELLEVPSKGLVPELTRNLHTFAPPRGLNKSTVILEYLEEYAIITMNALALPAYTQDSLADNTTGRTLLPPRTDSYAQAAHVSRVLFPAFYRFLQGQDQATGRKKFSAALGQLTSLERGERGISVKGGAGSGLWCEGGESNWTDVMVGPCTCSGQSIFGLSFSHTFPIGLSRAQSPEAPPRL